jgi:hypothetical protein
MGDWVISSSIVAVWDVVWVVVVSTVWALAVVVAESIATIATKIATVRFIAALWFSMPQ